MEGGGRIDACPWWEGVGALPPLENEKKILSEEILTSFTYVLLMKLGGGAIDTLYMQGVCLTVARGECISSRASGTGTPVITSPAGE